MVSGPPVFQGADDLLDDGLADIRSGDGLAGAQLALCGAMSKSVSGDEGPERGAITLTFSRVTS